MDGITNQNVHISYKRYEQVYEGPFFFSILY